MVRPDAQEVGLITADRIKSLLGLEPLPLEGGYYAESYRSAHIIPAETTSAGSTSPRSLATAIYYLLTPDTFSALHRLPADEVYHFYLGDPVEMLRLRPDGSSDVSRLGSNILSGMQLQMIVPAGVWQGSRLVEGGTFALLGTTMSPGFDPADYEAGDRDRLVERYPDRRRLIEALTR
jgi:predicted cupin superfamily sugar epimerase